MLVVATQAQVRRVVAASAPVLRHGVTLGMTLAHARALLPAERVHQHDHDPRRDAVTLNALARWAERFCPVVSVDPPDGLLLDIAGCEHLFGGEAALCAAARDGLRLLGFAARMGVADTVGTAWAVARYGRGGLVRVASGKERAALAPLPIAALRVESAIVDAFAEVAVESVGQVLELPRSTLPARYGEDVLHRIDQALGTLPEPVGRLPEAVVFTVSRELPGGTTQLEAIEGMVCRLLGELTALLERHESGLRRLDLAFDRLDLATIPMHLIVTRPTRSERHLWNLLRPQVERVHMGFGIERITLRASRVARVVHQQRALHEHTARGDAGHVPIEHDDAAFAEVVDTLAARLGHENVLRLELVASHRPEHAERLVPFHTTPTPTPKAPKAPTSEVGPASVDRPSRLLEIPERVRVLSVTPDGPVLKLWRGGSRHAGDGQDERKIVASIGPERMSTEWWRGREPSRDYFRVQEESGRWLWLYQERQTRAWFLHGEWM